VRGADLVVGTSAGARVAVEIAGGRGLGDLYALEADPAQQSPEPKLGADPRRWEATVSEIVAGGGGAPEVLRRLGALSAGFSSEPESERFAEIEGRLPVIPWPERRVLVAAVNADTGARRVFDRDSGVDLLDAVAASAAVPGLRPLVLIEGHRYMDGGFYSLDNADLAAGCDRVLILTLRPAGPPLSVVSLRSTLEVLGRAGARVEVVHPDGAAEAAFASVHGNLLDPSVRTGAAGAGRAQGRAAAALVESLWR
jgi:NTE family protein